MFRIFCLLIGYGFGCIQTAYIIGAAVGKIDIRKHGSGGAGFTNATRVMGAKAGIIVFVCDFLKAIAAYIVCSLIFGGGGSFFGDAAFRLPGIYAGVGVVLGHNFPFYLKFKGGKGVASTMGFLMAFDWLLGLIEIVIGVSIAIFSKYVSLGSIIAAILITCLAFVFKYDAESTALLVFLSALALFQHRKNIVRLFKGTENKFTAKKNQSEEK